eukprot:TRINITY_DN1544_c0_g1_i2.p2 TRINITY_DN1544_c0_g1~~TRINITY_DN1544_c0_g1_i2.p2  ORF type:complete len:140 (-),score=32.97 TRINITY_DN1544_c0_g1_i2:51-470(-)
MRTNVDNICRYCHDDCKKCILPENQNSCSKCMDVTMFLNGTVEDGGNCILPEECPVVALLEDDNDAENINQCVVVCPDKYIKYTDHFCRRCYDNTLTGECITKGDCLEIGGKIMGFYCCLLYTSPSPRDRQKSRMPSSA